MKGRLRELALPLPQIALARHQALAEHEREPPIAAALDVVSVVGHEHVLHVRGVVAEHVAKRAEAQERDVAVLGPCSLEKPQRVAQTLGEAAEDRDPARAGRPSCRGTVERGTEVI